MDEYKDTIMIEHLIKCEQWTQCRKQSAFDFYPIQHVEIPIPEDWLVVFTGGTVRYDTALHFCSKECIRAWARKTAGDKS